LRERGWIVDLQGDGRIAELIMVAPAEDAVPALLRSLVVDGAQLYGAERRIDPPLMLYREALAEIASTP
jgi:hypothetical protein